MRLLVKERVYWSPATLAALEEAMEPKFLRDMREESMREENEGQGEAN